MTEETPDERISSSDWDKTPESVKAVVIQLAEKLDHLNRQFVLLNSQVQPLSEQMRELEDRVVQKQN